MTESEISLLDSLQVHDVYIAEIEKVLKELLQCNDTASFSREETPTTSSDILPESPHTTSSSTEQENYTKSEGNRKRNREPEVKSFVSKKKFKREDSRIVKNRERKVICSTHLSSEEKNILKYFAQKMQDAHVVDSWSHEVTHLVCKTQGGCAPRSMKYFFALLQGTWVVSHEWIMQSDAADYWLDEEEFEVERDQIGGEGIAKKMRKCAALGKKNKLFEGYRLLFSGKFSSPSAEELSTLQDLVGKAGMEIVKKCEHKKKIDEDCIILSGNRKDAKKMKKCQAKPVTLLWLLDSISNHCVQSQSDYEWK
jgi:hypothetical protein